jgi:hypothetical protein
VCAEILLERRLAIGCLKNSEEFGDEVDQHVAEYRMFVTWRKPSRRTISPLSADVTVH